jgi:acetate kinase
VDRLSVPSILCVNAGSSTLKCARFRVGDGALQELGRHEVEAESGALDRAIRALGLHDAPPAVVAHRVVHGGPHLDEHCLVDARVLDELRRVVPFAPLHLPAELAALDETHAWFPDAAQVACFDTSFHRTLPTVARRLPLPELFDRVGVRRYGFHGLSCEYVVSALDAASARVVIAHLGSGASLTAVRDGRSVDTTMGLTPTGGVVMATRSGDLDPGVMLYLAREQGLEPDALEAVVNHESGLLGLSGTTGDMRALLEARARGDRRATLAVDAFCASVRKHVGALVTALGGLDILVFTGGIGEHAPTVRELVCRRLGHLGVEIDHERNGAGAAMISGDGCTVAVRVIPTDENLVAARHAIRLAGLRDS